MSGDSSRVLTYLKRVSLFREISEASLERLAPHCRVRRYREGEYLFHEGEDGYTLYLLLSGQVSVQRTNEDGETIFIAQRGPGEHFGEMSLLDGEPRSADVVTIDCCEAMLLRREPFLEWVTAEPSVALNLLASLTRRLRQATDSLDEQKSLNAMGRLCARLLELMETHGQAAAGGVRITLKLTQEQLAERVGVDRATVNRQLSALREMKAIRNEGRSIIVLDKARLRHYANME